MISNSTQLQVLGNEMLKKAMDNTTEKLLQELIRIIDATVYNSNPEWYQRTMQFRDSWDRQDAVLKLGYVESEIFQNLSAMVWNPENFQHGNIHSPLEGHGLSDILNDGTSNSAFGFSPVEATLFWDEFERYVIVNLDGIFITECIKLGLPITWVNATF